MATDLAMLEARCPAFRTYSWQPHCVSLGRFEKDSDIDSEAAARLGVDIARRPTGGGAILHGLDVTFCLVRPAPPGSTVQSVYTENARALSLGLRLLGIDASCAEGKSGVAGDAACFAGARGPDLRAGGRKVCGSALRIARGWCLMHGSVALWPDWERTARVIRGTSAEVLARAAVALSELRPGTKRREVEEALTEGVRRCFAEDGRFVGVEACARACANPQPAL